MKWLALVGVIAKTGETAPSTLGETNLSLCEPDYPCYPDRGECSPTGTCSPDNLECYPWSTCTPDRPSCHPDEVCYPS